MDTKDYYYGTPLDFFKYLVSEEIIVQYNLCEVSVNGWVYLEIRKAIPGLKQAGKIGHDCLAAHIKNSGYTPGCYTPALWKGDTREILFTVVVDDFRFKYVGK